MNGFMRQYDFLFRPIALIERFVFSATKSWIGAALMIGGALLSGYGSKRDADATAAQMDFNARQTMMDAAIARQNAEAQAKFIRSQGVAQARVAREEAQMLRESGRRLTGRQRTQIAKSGLRMEGTPLELIAETIENIELDAIKHRQAGIYKQKEADWQAGLVQRGASFQAGQMESSAAFQSGMAGSTRTAGTISMFSSFLGGGAGAASMFA